MSQRFNFNLRNSGLPQPNSRLYDLEHARADRDFHRFPDPPQSSICKDAAASPSHHTNKGQTMNYSLVCCACATCLCFLSMLSVQVALIIMNPSFFSKQVVNRPEELQAHDTQNSNAEFVVSVADPAPTALQLTAIISSLLKNLINEAEVAVVPAKNGFNVRLLAADAVRERVTEPSFASELALRCQALGVVCSSTS